MRFELDLPLELVQHIEIIEEPRGIRHLKCRYCDTRFFSLEDAVRHLTKYHKIDLSSISIEGLIKRIRRRRKKG